MENPTRKAVEALVQAGVLKEVTGREWGRVYLAGAISEAIQNPPGM